MRRVVILTILALAIPVLVLAQTPTSAQTAAEKAIRETDAALAKAAAAKNVDQCMALFDPEAAIPNAEGTVYGVKDPKAFREVWEKLFAIPGFNLTWTAEEVIVLKSGGLAFSSGSFDNGFRQGEVLRGMAQTAGWEVEGAGGCGVGRASREEVKYFVRRP